MLNFLHILFCILLIIVVLLQKGKGAQAGAGVMVGASQTTFGSQGASGFLYRSTQYLGAGLMLVCILIARSEHQVYVDKNVDFVNSLPYSEIAEEES